VSILRHISGRASDGSAIVDVLVKALASSSCRAI
jgi:hypothetical protein